MSRYSSWEITSPLWDQACKEHDRDPRAEMPWRIKRQVSERYLSLILQLPNHKLELILRDFHSGRVNRAPETIDRIVSELAERVLLGKSHVS